MSLFIPEGNSAKSKEWFVNSWEKVYRIEEEASIILTNLQHNKRDFIGYYPTEKVFWGSFYNETEIFAINMSKAYGLHLHIHAMRCMLSCFLEMEKGGKYKNMAAVIQRERWSMFLFAVGF